MFALINVSWSQDDLKLCPNMVESEETHSIHVAVENFENMVSFQFAVAWNSWDYEFVGVENLNGNLEYFDPSAVSPLLDTIYDDIQMVRFSWFNPFGTSSLNDGQDLFEIKLKPLRDVMEPNFGIFNDNLFMLEFVDASIQVIPVKLDGEGCHTFSLEDIASSVREEIQTEIEIYPNPTKDVLNIDFEVPFAGEIKVMNVAGQQMLTQDIDRSSSTTLQLKHLNAGEYFLHLEDQEGKVKTKGITVIK